MQTCKSGFKTLRTLLDFLMNDFKIEFQLDKTNYIYMNLYIKNVYIIYDLVQICTCPSWFVYKLHCNF